MQNNQKPEPKTGKFKQIDTSILKDKTVKSSSLNTVIFGSSSEPIVKKQKIDEFTSAFARPSTIDKQPVQARPSTIDKQPVQARPSTIDKQPVQARPLVFGLGDKSPNLFQSSYFGNATPFTDSITSFGAFDGPTNNSGSSIFGNSRVEKPSEVDSFVFNTVFGTVSSSKQSQETPVLKETSKQTETTEQKEQTREKKFGSVLSDDCQAATKEIRSKNPDQMAENEHVIYVKKFEHKKESADIQIDEKTIIKLFDLDNKVLGSLHFRKLDNREAACYITNLGNYWVDIVKAIDGFNTRDRYLKLAVLCYREIVAKLT